MLGSSGFSFHKGEPAREDISLVLQINQELQHQPDNFVILASFSDNKQGTFSVSKIISIETNLCASECRVGARN